MKPDDVNRAFYVSGGEDRLANKIEPKAANRALAKNSQQAMTEITELASQIEQNEGDQNLKSVASQIKSVAQQVQQNQQTEAQI